MGLPRNSFAQLFHQRREQFQLAGVRLEQHLRDGRRAAEVAVNLEGRMGVEQVRQCRAGQEESQVLVGLDAVAEAGAQFLVSILNGGEIDGRRVLSTECSLCQTCITVCAKDALKLSFGFDLGGKDLLRERAPKLPAEAVSAD